MVPFAMNAIRLISSAVFTGGVPPVGRTARGPCRCTCRLSREGGWAWARRSQSCRLSGGECRWLPAAMPPGFPDRRNCVGFRKKYESWGNGLKKKRSRRGPVFHGANVRCISRCSGTGEDEFPNPFRQTSPIRPVNRPSCRGIVGDHRRPLQSLCVCGSIATRPNAL